MKKAIFLDRDGTLNVDIGYAYKVEDCALIEDDIAKVLKKIQKKGYLLIITTNQAGIDKGYYREKNFWEFMRELERQLGLQFDGVYFCPYHPDFSGNFPCRKPDNGMILQAQKEFNIDCKASFMIGDSEKDMAAGKKSKCKTILINTQDLNSNTFKTKPDFTVRTWQEIESIIL
ncbi:D-glycero-beta-D-manno-heptose-1,7-bisphosphate 7-phosphatase [Candidatus Gracilibacteria bacterium]|nr:MAG: D-glycero-beta-D-manno-heptose-1,7-bisphosphate 7-phosphatase [Candidatus Gracilibacteria bacterium]